MLESIAYGISEVYQDSQSKKADRPSLKLKELNNSEVLVEIIPKPDTTIYYSTTGNKPDFDSFVYETPITLKIGYELQMLIYNEGKYQQTTYSVKIQRNDSPYCYLDNDYNLGNVICFANDGNPVMYAIFPELNFDTNDQYALKNEIHWKKYSLPIDTSSFEQESVVIAFFTPVTEDKISSNIEFVKYNSPKGACFDYIFYDKGNYTDGWRYIEISPFVEASCYGRHQTTNRSREHEPKKGTGPETRIPPTRSANSHSVQLSIQLCFLSPQKENMSA